MSDSDRLPPISSEGDVSLRTSLHSLQSQYPKAPERFAWLGLLPEEVTLTPPMMAVWWQMEVSDAQHQLELFCQEGLLLAAAPMTIGGQDYPCYHLHAPFHDMARRLLFGEAEHGLGLSIKEAHRILLERYYDRLPSPQEGERSWSQLEEDGYIHDHLTWHIEQAAHFEPMLLLLNAETANGKNAWFEAQDRLGKMTRYREDVKRSWRAVQRRSQEAAERGEPITTLGLELRHCLILASLNSLNADMPVELIAGLVQCGMWPLTVGVTYLRQISFPWERLKAFAAFAPSLTAAQLSELVSIVRNTETDSDRDDLFTEIAKARAAMGDTGQAIEIARAIGDAYHRAEVLTEVADRLPQVEEQSLILAEALASAQTVEAPPSRARALTEIVNVWVAIGETNQALAIAQTMEDAFHRASALTEIACPLPLSEERSRLLAEALEIARTVEDAYFRAWALCGTFTYLPQSEERSQVAAEALAIARKVKGASYRANVLGGIACRLPDAEERAQVMAEALANARKIQDASGRERHISDLVKALAATGDTEQALAIAETVAEDYYRVALLREIAEKQAQTEEQSQLPAEELASAPALEEAASVVETPAGIAAPPICTEARLQELAEALSRARTSDDADACAEALPGLAIALVASGDTEQAVSLARTIKNAYLRAEAFTGMVTALAASGDPEQALAIARTMEKEDYLLQALTAIVGSLNVAQLSEALAIVGAMGGSHYRAKALIAIAPHLTEEQLSEALAIAQAIWEPSSRAEALTKLAGYLTAEQLSEGLTIVRMTENPLPRAKELRKLAGHLTLLQLSDALSIGGASQRADSLDGIAKALAGIGDTEQALSIARMMKDAASQAEALMGISGDLTAAQIREVLAVAHTIDSGHDRALALAGIAGQLPQGEKRSRTFSQARAIVWTGWGAAFRAETFTGIVSRLPPSEERSEILTEALTIARTIDYDKQRVEALLGLARQMPPSEERDQIFAEALSTARTIPDVSYRGFPQLAQALSEVAKALAAIGEIEQALSVAWLIDDPVSSDTALTADWTWEAVFVRKEMLCGIAAAFINVPAESFYPLFTSLMQLCVVQTGEVLPKVIGQMSVVLLEQGTRQTIDELLRAFQDVGRWWPEGKGRMVIT